MKINVINGNVLKMNGFNVRQMGGKYAVFICWKMEILWNN